MVYIFGYTPFFFYTLLFQTDWLAARGWPLEKARQKRLVFRSV